MRALLRYHGGKFRLAPWIISHFPPHRVYVEPFGGAANVLLQKERSYAEVYNDLDDEVVTLFRVLRDPVTAGALISLLRVTPFARVEYRSSFELSDDPVESSRRLIVRSLMGFGSNSINRMVSSGFRSNSNRSGTTPAHDWMNYPDALAGIIGRLSGVVIEHDDALSVVARFDVPDCLFYVDPPYPHSTRTTAGKGYTHEMTDDEHRKLGGGIV